MDSDQPTKPGLPLRIVHLLRDAWLVLGVSFALLVVLELAYRVQAAVQSSLHHPDRSASVAGLRHSPYADSAWNRDFAREQLRYRPRWEPFAYFRGAPQSGRYINIDSAGLRVVPRYRVAGGAPVRVFFLGGSTTWGYEERDSNTRAAVVARRLAAAGFDAEVVNFAQPGYTSGQELVTLLTELRRGNVPDAVVFWDGVNDVSALRQNGRPGLSYREFDRVDDATFNTRRKANHGRVDMRLAIRSLLTPSELITRFFEAVARPAPLLPLPEPGAFCRTLMSDWLGQARVVDRLAGAYDFTPLVIWQPQWQTSGSPRSAYEQMAETTTVFRPGDAGLTLHRIECARVADSLVAAHAAESIRNWARMHTGDTATVYFDQYSHTTERATAIEADTVAVELIDGLRRKVCGRRPGDALCALRSARSGHARP